MVTGASRLILTFICVALSPFAHAKHGELDQPTEPRGLPACERRLFNPDFLHGRLTGEPENPLDPLGFVTDAYPLTVDTMIRAYSNGLFADKESKLNPGHAVLVNPIERGVMFLDPNDPDKGISRRDLRTIRRMRAEGYKVRFDTDFRGVLIGCRDQERRRASPLAPRPWRSKHTALTWNPTWITENFVNVFLEMHVLQYAHSAEVFYNNQLVAGLFGTYVAGVFTGESMFYVPGIGDNAVKLALWELRRRLMMKGHSFIDTEETVGLIQDWGGENLPREKFQRLRTQQSLLDLPF